MKKTIKIDDLKDFVNNQLATNIDRGSVGSQYRMGLITVLEHFLLQTNNYKGYSYLRQHQVPPQQLAGIIFDKTGDQKHVYPDESRRYYS